MCIRDSVGRDIADMPDQREPSYLCLLLLFVIQMAGHKMAGLLLHHRRLFPGADLHALGAAGVERTALGRRHGAGDVPLQHKLGGVFLP